MRRKYVTENDSSLNIELLANAIYFDQDYLVSRVKDMYKTKADLLSYIPDAKSHLINKMDVSEVDADTFINNFIEKYYKEV